MRQYYSTEKVTEHITAIRSLTGELLYLVEGSEKAVLIDTCVGVGHLKEYVEQLTDKPYVVLLTHGHIDHAMGAPEFEQVYMNHKDIPVYKNMCPIEERKGYIQGTLPFPMEELEITDQELVPATPEYSFRQLKEGDTFDLGGIHMDTYEFPGHTPGSMVFLIREEKVLILGDACNNSTFLFDDICLSVEAYKEQVIRIHQLLEGAYDMILLSHHEIQADTDIMTNMIQVCHDVLAGKADDIPFNFMGKEAFIAKKCNERFQRVDGKSANLIYSKNRVK